MRTLVRKCPMCGTPMYMTINAGGHIIGLSNCRPTLVTYGGGVSTKTLRCTHTEEKMSGVRTCPAYVLKNSKQWKDIIL